MNVLNQKTNLVIKTMTTFKMQGIDCTMKLKTGQWGEYCEVTMIDCAWKKAPIADWIVLNHLEKNGLLEGDWAWVTSYDMDNDFVYRFRKND